MLPRKKQQMLASERTRRTSVKAVTVATSSVIVDKMPRNAMAAAPPTNMKIGKPKLKRNMPRITSISRPAHNDGFS
jgi:hypothetical protein